MTFLTGLNRYPVWTPDGRAIVFMSTDPKGPGIYWIRSDGSGAAERWTDGKQNEMPFSFSPDGKRLAFVQFPNNGLPDIWTAPVEGDSAHPKLGKPEFFLGTPFADAEPAFSPDGRWMAYASNESGTMEVYVRPFPGPGGRWQISTGGGRFPVWSRSGHELFYEKVAESIKVVSYTAKGDSFTAGTPKNWVAAHFIGTGNLSNYDLAPDGKRIVTFLQTEDAEGQKAMTHLTLLLNFFDELRRKTK